MTEAERQTVSALASLAGGLAGALTGGGDVNAIAGALAAKNAVENNYLSVEEATLKKTLTLKEREGTITPEEAQELADLKKVDKDRNAAIQAACATGSKGGVECGTLVAMAKQALVEYGGSISYSLLYEDIYPEDAANVENILQGLDSESITRDTAITAIAKESGLSRDEIESRYDLVMSLQAATAALAGLYGVKSLLESPVPPKGSSGKVDAIKDILSPNDFPEVAAKISQKQLRHIAGRPELEARGGGGFLNSVDDAQKVLDAYRAGQVNILGRNAQGFPVVKFESVIGTNVNAGAGITGQPTSVFIIKGTKSPSIVPANPNWSQK
ncbi:hypothetical protein PSCICM_35010 [Pseudomonas cichorii]|uniref:VENN motif pre-toxin domain-containing protein n=1 Tax=Pseudomonas cichorii TaxID=36746 RepID=UPI001910DA4E|nr:VENN motif pre-toxin domain-containing protein [Pseudomonas cichorii]GFM77682.1 hypothetical protein PSCICM_35010 [Pseudomonas cichorii]